MIKINPDLSRADLVALVKKYRDEIPDLQKIDLRGSKEAILEAIQDVVAGFTVDPAQVRDIVDAEEDDPVDESAEAAEMPDNEAEEAVQEAAVEDAELSAEEVEEKSVTPTPYRRPTPTVSPFSRVSR